VPGRAPAWPGLCESCRWMQPVTNRSGSTFLRCALSDRDARFPRYPPLPVLACAGYERQGAASAADDDAG